MRRASIALLLVVPLAGCSPLLYAIARLRAAPPRRTLVLDHAAAGSTESHADGRHAPSCAGRTTQDASDQAWTFVPPADGPYDFRVEAPYDPVVAVFDAERELGCNDDAEGEDTADADLALPLVRGHAYAVVVDGYRGDRGAYTLRASRAVARAAPARAAVALDACAGSRTLPEGLSAVALDDGAPGAQTACGEGAGALVRVEIARGGRLSLRAAGPFELAIELRAACAGPPLACVRSDPGARDATLALHLVAGAYYVVLAGGQRRGPVALDMALRADAP